jgi:hypothetical protein
MSELKYKNTDKYYWCAWGDNITHFGQLQENQKVTTGLENFESYKTESELKAKVDSLEGAGYYDNNKGDL